MGKKGIVRQKVRWSYSHCLLRSYFARSGWGHVRAKTWLLTVTFAMPVLRGSWGPSLPLWSYILSVSSLACPESQVSFLPTVFWLLGLPRLNCVLKETLFWEKPSSLLSGLDSSWKHLLQGAVWNWSWCSSPPCVPPIVLQNRQLCLGPSPLSCGKVVSGSGSSQ